MFSKSFYIKSLSIQQWHYVSSHSIENSHVSTAHVQSNADACLPVVDEVTSRLTAALLSAAIRRALGGTEGDGLLELDAGLSGTAAAAGRRAQLRESLERRTERYQPGPSPSGHITGRRGSYCGCLSVERGGGVSPLTVTLIKMV